MDHLRHHPYSTFPLTVPGPGPDIAGPGSAGPPGSGGAAAGGVGSGPSGAAEAHVTSVDHPDGVVRAVPSGQEAVSSAYSLGPIRAYQSLNSSRRVVHTMTSMEACLSMSHRPGREGLVAGSSLRLGDSSAPVGQRALTKSTRSLVGSSKALEGLVQMESIGLEPGLHVAAGAGPGAAGAAGTMVTARTLGMAGTAAAHPSRPIGMEAASQQGTQAEGMGNGAAESVGRPVGPGPSTTDPGIQHPAVDVLLSSTALTKPILPHITTAVQRKTTASTAGTGASGGSPVLRRRSTRSPFVAARAAAAVAAAVSPGLQLSVSMQRQTAHTPHKQHKQSLPFTLSPAATGTTPLPSPLMAVGSGTTMVQGAPTSPAADAGILSPTIPLVLNVSDANTAATPQHHNDSDSAQGVSRAGIVPQSKLDHSHQAHPQTLAPHPQLQNPAVQHKRSTAHDKTLVVQHDAVSPQQQQPRQQQQGMRMGTSRALVSWRKAALSTWSWGTSGEACWHVHACCLLPIILHAVLFCEPCTALY